jgi:hypothetical protein
MNRPCKGWWLMASIALAISFLSGCDEDKRVAQVAQEAAERQAQQNQEMARQNQRIAEATKELVQADAQARQDLAATQGNLRADQAEVGKQRDQLETERKQIATERKWDQLLAPALVDFGILLAIVAVLGFCWYLLMGLRHETITDQAVEEILVQELVSEHPQILPPAYLLRPALEHADHHLIQASKTCEPDFTRVKKANLSEEDPCHI